jgi:hypothetical protein
MPVCEITCSDIVSLGAEIDAINATEINSHPIGDGNMTIAHSELGSLGADDHSQYPLLLGRTGGQTLIGSVASGENLTLKSTSHATKGKIILGTAAAYNEATSNLGLGTTSPSCKAHLVMAADEATGLYVDGSTNDYSGAGIALGINLVRDYNVGTGDINSCCGISNYMYPKHTAATVPSTKYSYAAINRLISDGKITNATAVLKFFYQYGEYAWLDDRNIYDTAGIGSLLISGVAVKALAESSALFTDTGGTAPATNTQLIGVDVEVSNSPTLGSGSLYPSAMGVKLDVEGTAVGSSICYGIYIYKVAGADVNYAVYDNSGAPWELDTSDLATTGEGSFGTLKAGDVAGGHYTEVEAGGTVKFNGDATVWEDLRVPGLATRVGAVAPGFDAFLGAGGLYAYTFDGSGARVEEVHFVIQIPHSYKEGSNIYPHVHWTPTTADAGNVVWQLEYTWANISGTFPAVATIASTAAAAGGTAWVHKMSVFAAISGADKTISSMLVCRLFRDGGHASDTYAHDVSLLEFDIHYESDTVGSRTETAK